jgi:hypothetical protein
VGSNREVVRMIEEVKTKEIAIGKLRKAEYNPRMISKEQFEALVKSIREFGFVQPIVVNKRSDGSLVVVGGHQRLEAAKRIGMKQVPTILVGVPEEKEKLLNLALNRITGEWNKEILAPIVKELNMNKSIDLSVAGFYPEEVDRLMAKMSKEGKPTTRDFDTQIRLSSKVEKLLRSALVEGRGSVQGQYLYVIDPDTSGILTFHFSKETNEEALKKYLETVGVVKVKRGTKR